MKRKLNIKAVIELVVTVTICWTVLCMNIDFVRDNPLYIILLVFLVTLIITFVSRKIADLVKRIKNKRTK